MNGCAGAAFPARRMGRHAPVRDLLGPRQLPVRPSREQGGLGGGMGLIAC
jgi:hypothetical protein